MEGVGHPVPCVVAPAGGGQQLGKFSGGALAASDHEHHVDVKELRKMRFFRTRHNEIGGEHPTGPDHRPAQIGEDPHAFVIAPVVQDRFQNIGIGRRHLAEHVSTKVAATFGQSELSG